MAPHSILQHIAYSVCQARVGSGFVMLCFVLVRHWSILPISSSMSFLAPGQPYDCPGGSKTVLTNIDYKTMCPVGHQANGPLARCVKLRVAHAPGTPGMLSPALTSKETAR